MLVFVGMGTSSSQRNAVHDQILKFHAKLKFKFLYTIAGRRK